MKFKRIGRVLVCLLLVSALLINASPIKAKATGVGATAAITAASTVLTPAGMVVGATFIALGLAAAANPEGFQNMVDAGVSALESAGTWVKDGMVELLRTEDADGNASYYVDSGMMEVVRDYSYSSGVLTNVPVSTQYVNEFGRVWRYYSTNGSFNVGWAVYSDRILLVFYSTTKFNLYSASGNPLGVSSYNGVYYSFYSFTRPTYDYRSITPSLGVYSNRPSSSDAAVCSLIDNGVLGRGSYSTSHEIALGSYPSVDSNLTDGTSARQWSEEYTDRGLYVVQGGGDPDPDHDPENNGTWFWSIMIPLTALELYSMSQADEWSGQTPQEFDDYTTKTEFEILSQPEIEFGHGIEIRPVTSPTPDSGGGTDPTQPGEGDEPGENTEPTSPPGGSPEFPGTDNPDPGGDGNTGTESGNQTDYINWFERIIKGIEELPSKFENWITDCKTAIEELPSKFADWFNNIASKLERIIEGITTLGQQFAQGLQTLGQNIVSGIQNAISTLFQPSPNYFSDKVAALKAKHHNIDKFTQLGNDFKLFFTGLGSKAPVIWIDLGAATGSYIWGGEHIFMDLTWYSQYKPKMDFILGAIIWLWLGWRVFLSVPGIINGASGVWGKYHRGGSRDDN